VIRIVVTGSECTGKTTLAVALAEAYETAWVPEFVRRFVEKRAAAPTYADVDAIARNQITLEDERAAAAPGGPVLIQDTDLLSTIVYSHHYYGTCPVWIEDALRRRAPDLYLLADIEVPWVADGGQRDRGDRREEMQGLFRDALRSRGLAFADIRGTPDERLAMALSVIDEVVRPEHRSRR